MVDWNYIAGFMDGEGWVSFGFRVDSRGNRFLAHNVGCCQSTPQDRCLHEIAAFLKSQDIPCKIHVGRDNGPRRHPISKLYLKGGREPRIRFLREIAARCFVKNFKAAELIRLFEENPTKTTFMEPEMYRRKADEALALYAQGCNMRKACRQAGIAEVTLRKRAAEVGFKLRSKSETLRLGWHLRRAA